MRNPILSAVLRTALFWWVIAYLWWFIQVGPSTELFVIPLTNIRDGFGALALGLVVAFGLQMNWRWIQKGWLEATTTRGILCTLGPLPGRASQPRARRLPSLESWPKTQAWFARAPSLHAQAFRAVLATLYHDPNRPTTLEKGKHGDEPLWRHSLNVVENGLSWLEQGWTYQGRANDRLNGQSFGLADADLLVLILIAHDLGKVDTYVFEQGQRRVPGRYVERFLHHDRRGPQVLARLDETWELENDERRTLCLVIGHDHHGSKNPWQALPEHATDFDALALAFLRAADSFTAAQEEGKAPSMTESGGHTESRPIEPTGRLSDDEQERIWRWFLDYLVKPNTINGRDKRFRVGFKATDGRIMLNESQVRRAFAKECLEDPALGEERRGDGTYLASRQLMEVLGEKGVLLCEHDGQRFSPTEALWRSEAVDPKKNKVVGQWNATIVLEPHESLPPRVLGLPAAEKPPRITGPVFPQRALTKNSGVSEEAEQPNAVKQPSDSPPATNEPTPDLPLEREGPGIDLLGATAAPALPSGSDHVIDTTFGNDWDAPPAAEPLMPVCDDVTPPPAPPEQAPNPKPTKRPRGNRGGQGKNGAKAQRREAELALLEASTEDQALLAAGWKLPDTEEPASRSDGREPPEHAEATPPSPVPTCTEETAAVAVEQTSRSNAPSSSPAPVKTIAIPRFNASKSPARSSPSAAKAPITPPEAEQGQSEDLEGLRADLARRAQTLMRLLQVRLGLRETREAEVIAQACVALDEPAQAYAQRLRDWANVYTNVTGSSQDANALRECIERAKTLFEEGCGRNRGAITRLAIRHIINEMEAPGAKRLASLSITLAEFDGLLQHNNLQKIAAMPLEQKLNLLSQGPATSIGGLTIISGDDGQCERLCIEFGPYPD